MQIVHIEVRDAALDCLFCRFLYEKPLKANHGFQLVFANGGPWSSRLSHFDSTSHRQRDSGQLSQSALRILGPGEVGSGLVLIISAVVTCAYAIPCRCVLGRAAKWIKITIQEGAMIAQLLAIEVVVI